jgi:hypothetical protein
MKFKDLRIWMLIFGGMLLLGAYLYQHSKTNQKQLETQGIKAVHLARQNFVEAFYNYHVQLEGYFKRNFYNWAGGEAEGAASRMVQLIDRNPKFGIKEIKSLEMDPSHDRSVLHHEGISLTKKDSVFLIGVKGFRFYLDERTRQGALPELDDSLLVRSLRENLGVRLRQESAGARAFEVDHVLPVHALMENNLQSLFFDRMFVLDSAGTAIYPRDVAGLAVIPLDSLGGRRSAGEEKLSIQLSGSEYQGFLSPAIIGNKVFYLLGIKEKAQFDRVALRIDFKLLSTFLTLLLLVFVSIPIISVFNLGDGDVLTKKRVMGLGLSLILVMLILGFFSFSLVQNYRSSSPADTYVRDLKHAFSDEINGLIVNLDRFSKELRTHSDDNRWADSLNPDKNVNEFLEFNGSGHILNMLIPDALDGTIEFGDFPFISIANRDYVRERPREPGKHFISAHFSKSTGNLEGVISKSQGEHGYALTFRLDSLAPKISRNQRFFVFKPDGKVLLKSEKVNIPINYLQEGIGEEKWDEIKTLIVNNHHAGEEQVWKTPIYVNGYEYEALLSRIPSGQFVSENWLLYLENKNLQHALHSLSSLEAFTVFIPYVLVLAMLALLVLLTSKSSIYLAYTPFSFEWYSPSPTKRSKFLWLNGILFLDLLLFVAVYLFLPLSIFKIFLWSALFAIQSGTCNFLLLSSSSKDRHLTNTTAFSIVSVGLWLLVSILLLQLSWVQSAYAPLLLTSFFLVVLGLLQFACFRLARVRDLPSLAPGSWKGPVRLQRIHQRMSDFWNRLTGVHVDKRVYALNFLLWLLIIGFLPGYFIHRQIFNQERFIWNVVEQEEPYLRGQPLESNEAYLELIKIHEEFRRTNFGRFSNHEDELIRNFVAPPQDVMVQAFNMPPNFSLKEFFSEQSFWEIVKGNVPVLLALAVVLIWLFQMIMRLGNKIYLIDYHFTHGMVLLPQRSRKQQRSFLIGVDAAQNRNWIARQFDLSAHQMLRVDALSALVDMPEPDPTHEAIVFENIHCLDGADRLLESMQAFLMAYGDKKQFLFVTSGKPLQEIVQPSTSQSKRLLITEIFSEFLFQYVPLDFKSESVTLPFSGQEWESLDKIQREALKMQVGSLLFNDKRTQELAAEIACSPHSTVIATLITEELARDPLDQPLSQERYEKCILSIQRYNKAYFMNIWAELSLKERKMVYNYAREGFINFFNKETMTALIQKGIIKMNAEQDRLVLFSSSFRNFVCLFVSDADVERFKQDERKSGNAKMIQAAVFSFVLISIALISFYDPTILNETSAYISGVLGLVGTLYSLLAKGFTKAPEMDAP